VHHHHHRRGIVDLAAGGVTDQRRQALVGIRARGQVLVQRGFDAGQCGFEGLEIGAVVGILSLRPLGWLKERSIPQRAATRLSVELAEGASAGPVLAALESAGDVLALSRDGRRLEIEVRIDRAQRSRALDAVADLPQVEEARWQN